VTLVLDVDSDKINDFDSVDEQALQQLMRWVERFPQIEAPQQHQSGTHHP
jgi:putative methionine-R-sulfoxide reductase with GAF domain